HAVSGTPGARSGHGPPRVFQGARRDGHARDRAGRAGVGGDVAREPARGDRAGHDADDDAERHAAGPRPDDGADQRHVPGGPRRGRRRGAHLTGGGGRRQAPRTSSVVTGPMTIAYISAKNRVCSTTKSSASRTVPRVRKCRTSLRTNWTGWARSQLLKRTYRPR